MSQEYEPGKLGKTPEQEMEEQRRVWSASQIYVEMSRFVWGVASLHDRGYSIPGVDERELFEAIETVSSDLDHVMNGKESGLSAADKIDLQLLSGAFFESRNEGFEGLLASLDNDYDWLGDEGEAVVGGLVEIFAFKEIVEFLERGVIESSFNKLIKPAKKEWEIPVSERLLDKLRVGIWVKLKVSRR